ncbi:hypothetical protein CURE108131_10335 [Cupriavidus respiraculi]|uniref:Uncharacterized protein n=1 Tax=Cupriavidus respiraculi TaxID=195930 RepID=A0ABM8WPQ9_9BURK|nr:hypothetical protein [Cupriavidus respiraculi]CAG9169411.1 hypothetical protein LMG21510_01415 [Cupriavidus respiraculi]
MDGGFDVLVVRGFAVPEGKGKWTCCFEIRLATARSEPLLFRGEIHGCCHASEAAAVMAARDAGQSEARRRVESVRAQMGIHRECCVVVDPVDPADPVQRGVAVPLAGKVGD